MLAHRLHHWSNIDPSTAEIVSIFHSFQAGIANAMSSLMMNNDAIYEK